MSTRNVPLRPPRVRRFGALGGPLLIVVLALGGTMAGCSSSTDAVPSGAAPATSGATVGDPAPGDATTHATVPLGHMHMPTADEVTSTWKARPDYVKTLPPEWQEAYAFALSRPDVLQWLPCYCGCAAMDHRSNLDCFFQRREVKGNYAYEEHASYCDICVKTANMASRMLREGSTMVQIRAAVDDAFGGGAAPGTDTALPPST